MLTRDDLLVWSIARVVEAAFCIALLITWSFIPNLPEGWDGYITSISIAFVSYCAFLILSGYLISTFYIAKLIQIKSLSELVLLSVSLYLLHYIILLFLLGQFTFGTAVLTFLIGLLSSLLGHLFSYWQMRCRSQ